MKFKQNGNGKRLVFSELTYEKISQILSDLANHSHARTVIFADMDGYPISTNAQSMDMDITTLSALASGTFSATAAMAKLTSGEEKFYFIYQEGKLNNIYLCNVCQDYLLIVVFEKSTPLGLIRILTHQTTDKLKELVKELKDETHQVQQFIDAEFKSLLAQELNRAFGLNK